VIVDHGDGERANTSVVFTGAAWHSGSTVLGLMLGSHPSILYCGEAMCVDHFGDRTAGTHLRMCRLCGPACPIWGTLSPGLPGDVYESLSRRAARPIVFDSSKSVSWITAQAAALKDVVPVRLVVLVRDGRAVFNSHLRKLPEIPMTEHARRWSRKMRRVEALAASWPGSVHRLRYEELTTRPEAALRELSSFLGVAFDPVMLDPWNSDPHPLDSNPGPLLMLQRERGRAARPGLLEPDERTQDFYGSPPRSIYLDLRWRRELSPEALAVFEDISGEVNLRYRWE